MRQPVEANVLLIVSPNNLEVRLRANGIERLVLELRPDGAEAQRVEEMA